MASYVIDSELLIEEVRKYPELWDLSCETYRDRNMKQAAWMKICELFFPAFQNKTDKEKYELGTTLMKKWRHVRDNYIRTVNKKKKSGYAVDTGRTYVYAKQLSFLRSNAGQEAETQDSHSEDNNYSPANEFAFSSQPSFSSSTSRNDPNHSLAKRPKAVETTINFLNTPTRLQANQINLSDEDRSFFDSLLPAVKLFNMDQKLEFRSEVIELVKRIRMQNAIPSFNQLYAPVAPETVKTETLYLSPSSVDSIGTNEGSESNLFYPEESKLGL